MKTRLIFLWIILFVSGLTYAGTITVTSPGSGEVLKQGESHNIIWNGSGLTNLVKITLWQNNTFIGLVVKDLPASSTYRWTAGNYLGGRACGSGYKIKVREQGGPSFTTEGESNSFTIANLALTSPNGGENWADGSNHNITWTSCGISGNVTIELIKVIFNRSSYATAKALYTGSASTGSFSWTINENLKSSLQIGSKVKVENTYKIRITSVNNSSIKDMSDGVFKITPKRIVLGQIKPDFEVKDIFYKGSGGNSIVAKVINNGFKYNGHLTLKYDLRSGESGAVSQLVAMNRGEIKNINILSRTLGLCDKLSINVEVDSNKSINESNENNNMKHKNVFASSQSDAKIESVKVFSDDGRWVAVQNGGFIQKRSRSIRMQVTVRNCGGRRIQGAKVGANWDFISHWLSTVKKKKKGYPNSSVFYEDVKKWLPCHSILKKIQELSNKSIRPGSAKTFIINGDLRRDSCPGNTIKIIKNEVTVYFDNGESGYKKKNNILKFRISH